jgi:hypothetical protein
LVLLAVVMVVIRLQLLAQTQQQTRAAAVVEVVELRGLETLAVEQVAPASSSFVTQQTLTPRHH